MKRVIVPGVREECEFVCDSCKKDAYGCLQFSFWYGSKKDMTQATLHLCDECADSVINSIQRGLKISIDFQDIIEL